MRIPDLVSRPHSNKIDLGRHFAVDPNTPAPGEGPEEIPGGGSAQLSEAAELARLAKTPEVFAVGEAEPKPNKGLVLVAEDFDGVRKFIKAFLENAGYTVIEAIDGIKALEALEKHPEIKLLVLDSMMPNLTGFGVIKRLREAGNNIPIILTTGFMEEFSEEDRKLLESGPIILCNGENFVQTVVPAVEKNPDLIKTIGPLFIPVLQKPAELTRHLIKLAGFYSEAQQDGDSK